MYLIIDGDDVGRELERYVLTQDLSGLQIFTVLFMYYVFFCFNS